jgi:hypothetical protein
MNTTNKQSLWTSDRPRDDGLFSPSSSMSRSPVSPFPISPFSSIHNNKSPTIQWSNNGMPKVATLVSRNEVMERAAAFDIAPLLCRSGPTMDHDDLQALLDDVSRTDEPVYDPPNDAFFDDLEPFRNLFLDVLRCRSGPTDDDDLKALWDDAVSLADDPLQDQPSYDLFLDGLEMFENLFLDVDMAVFETYGFKEPPPLLPEKTSSSRPIQSPGRPMVASTCNHSSVATAGRPTWPNRPAAVMLGPKNVVQKKKRGRPKKSKQKTELVETNMDPKTDPVRQVVIRLSSLQSRIPMVKLTNHSSAVVAVGLTIGPRGSAPPGIMVGAAENVCHNNNKKGAKKPKLMKKTNTDGPNEEKTKVHKAVIRRSRPAKHTVAPQKRAVRTGTFLIRQQQDTLSSTPSSNQVNV